MKPRRLGAYLVIMVVAQLGLYVSWLFGTSIRSFYADPRIGLFVLEDQLWSGKHHPGVFSWVSVAWSAACAVTLLRGASGVVFYRVSEAVLALPSILFFGWVLVAHMSPAHGFSVPELTGPVLVFGLFTLVPFVLSFRIPRTAASWSKRVV